MAYEKLFNEIYSVVMLKYFWKEYQDGFVKSESPDWINRPMDFGMEVSQVLLPSDGQAESFLEKNLGKQKEEIPQDMIEKYGDQLYFYNDRLWAILDGGPENMSYQEKILFRFRKKLEKLNTNYEHLAENTLYLYVHTHEENLEELRKVMRQMAEEQNLRSYQFSRIFLDFKYQLYVLDFRKDTIEKIPVPDKAYLFMNEMTEKLRNDREWHNGMALSPQ